MTTHYGTRYDRGVYTGVERRRMPDRRHGSFGFLSGKSDIGAVFLAMFAGLGVTVLLIVLGLAIGLVSVDPGTTAEGARDISSFIGWWTVGSGLLGALVGGFLGGRAAGMLGKATPIAHGGAAWGLTMLTMVLIMGALSLSLFGTAVSSTAAVSDELVTASDQIAAQTGADPADIQSTLEQSIGTGAGSLAVVVSNEAGEAAWWTFAWLALALIGSIGGWMLGAMTKPFGRFTVAGRDAEAHDEQIEHHPSMN